MERFDTMLKAAEYATTLCGNFRFATSNDRYDAKGLLVLAETSDSENPSDEDSFYVVSQNGSIGFCEDGEEIDWLFLPSSALNENLPTKFQADPQVRYCPKCGSAVNAGAHFCGKCGGKLR